MGSRKKSLRDVFARINRYVVRLNAQELRDAEKPGPFKEYVDAVASDAVWGELAIFADSQISRKRDKEFVAELTVLMLEGPQDKKGSLDLYYSADQRSVRRESEIRLSRSPMHEPL